MHVHTFTVAGAGGRPAAHHNGGPGAAWKQARVDCVRRGAAERHGMVRELPAGDEAIVVARQGSHESGQTSSERRIVAVQLPYGLDDAVQGKEKSDRSASGVVSKQIFWVSVADLLVFCFARLFTTCLTLPAPSERVMFGALETATARTALPK